MPYTVQVMKEASESSLPIKGEILSTSSARHAARDHVAFGATIYRKRAASAPPFANRLAAFGNPCRGRAELD